MPPDNESRPCPNTEGQAGAAPKSSARTTPARLSASDEDREIAGRLVADAAEMVVYISEQAFGLLEALTDDQLRTMRWLGVHDDHWWRLFEECDRRGIEW